VPISVLLVDDVAEVRTIVRLALRARGGFDVVGEASTGQEAVDFATDRQPDIVVLDLGLPDLAGHDVVTMLRRVAPHARVVVFTGTEAADRSPLRTEVEGFVVKDRDVDYLVDLLEDVSRDGVRAAVFHVGRAPEEIASARRFVELHCDTWGYDGVLDEALLVVSELVTNAMTHARSGCELRVRDTGEVFRIEVQDAGGGSPELQRPTRESEHGRGLLLVSAMCKAWGVDTIDERHKVVWAELGPSVGSATG